MPSSSRALYEAAQKQAAKIQEKQGRDLTVDEFAEVVRMEPDRGVTNVRNTESAHWKRWLDPQFRCVVPFTSFAEFNNRPVPDGKPLGNTWFAFDAHWPLAFFAGIWVPQWSSVREVAGLPLARLRASPALQYQR